MHEKWCSPLKNNDVVVSQRTLFPSQKNAHVFTVSVLNFLSFTIIAGSYLWMYLVARNTHRAVQRESHTSESAMAFRMTLLVATDAACWFPIIALGIWSLAGFTVPPQVYFCFRRCSSRSCSISRGIISLFVNHIRYLRGLLYSYCLWMQR